MEGVERSAAGGSGREGRGTTRVVAFVAAFVVACIVFDVVVAVVATVVAVIVGCLGTRCWQTKKFFWSTQSLSFHRQSKLRCNSAQSREK